VFVISIHGFPQVEETEFVSENDVLKKSIAHNIGILSNISGNNAMAASIIKSINQECMLEKYKKNRLESELTQEIDLLNLEGLPMDPIIIFANIALTCSNKMNALLGFIFDSAFSFSGLIDAFREDEPFKEIIDDLVCYNNYAVKKDILHPNEYPNLNYKLVNETEAECEETVNKTRNNLAESISFFAEFVLIKEQKCLESEISTGAENIFLKYVLLIPLGLTDEQKTHAKTNFIADTFEGMEKLLACNMKKEEDQQNEITS